MRPAGRAEAEKALALNPTLSEPHSALGILSVSEFDWLNAEREYKLAIENNPNDAEPHYFYAINCLIAQKRFDEAISQFRRALELDPLSGIINSNFATGLIIARRFDEAHEQLRKTLELDPSFGATLWRASEFEAYLGNYASARELWIRAHPEAATVDFGTGKEGFFQGLLKLQGDRSLYRPLVYAMLGRKDEAFQDLTRDIEDYPVDMVFWIRRPELDSLHSDPRYAELLHRMNLSP
jgi:tetratricopeptide (TPR) repeat protein